jgi:hypothetical protein
MARTTHATCDICHKEFNPYTIYYSGGVCSDGGIVVNPCPNKVETCSKECLIKWLTSFNFTMEKE